MLFCSTNPITLWHCSASLALTLSFTPYRSLLASAVAPSGGGVASLVAAHAEAVFTRLAPRMKEWKKDASTRHIATAIVGMVSCSGCALSTQSRALSKPSSPRTHPPCSYASQS